VARVTFEPAGKVVEVASGTLVIDAAEAAGVDLPANCGGVCACTTCHVWIEAGAETLSGIGEREDDKLSEATGLRPESRLGCQARVGSGELVVRIPGNRVGHETT
jgi:2Fe-2S ferredoxin